MLCNYVEKQADGTYKFYRIDQDWLDGTLQKNYIEIPRERMSLSAIGLKNNGQLTPITTEPLLTTLFPRQSYIMGLSCCERFITFPWYIVEGTGKTI